MTVLVAMPYWGRSREWVRDAVRSVLSQKHRDLCLVVVGDGEAPPLARIRDSRLVTYVLPYNHGNYFARQVMLDASPFPWYAPHDADDWSEPDHLTTLLAMDSDAVMQRAVCFHPLEGEPDVRYGPYHVGLFATHRLREVGGYAPHVRIGQDTLLMALLKTRGLTASLTPTYHRMVRADSLTMGTDGYATMARDLVRRRNHAILQRCRRLSPSLIGPLRNSLVPAQVREDLHLHATKLAKMLR